MKRILIILLILLSANAFAQTGMMMNRFYITGALVLGKGDRTFADTSAWLQLGKDTTKKGMILPRVVLDSIKTTKRGLFVYDLKDSVLYHFDSNKRVRYMTYKDTFLIKQLIMQNTPATDTNIIATKYYVDNAGYIKYDGNATGSTIKIGTNDSHGLNIETNNVDRVKITADGNVGVGTDPVSGKLHVNGVTATDAIAYVNNTVSAALPGTYKNATWGIMDVGADGTTSDYTLINNPTNGQTVFNVPHATNTTHFYGKVEVNKTSDEVQLDLASSPSGHLYAGVSTGTFDGSNKGFVSFGNTYSSLNTTLVFGSGKLSIPNGNLLLGKYTDNTVDKLQVEGTIINHGIRFNNTTNSNPNDYNMIRRFIDGQKDGIELVCGGASGGYVGGFRLKTKGGNATAFPIESFIVKEDYISMGYHTQDANGNGGANFSSQINMVNNNPDGQMLNMWNRNVGSPVIQTFSNYVYGSGGPTMTGAIVCEADNYSYRGLLSFFTNNGAWGNWASNTRAMLIDGYQNVGIGLSRDFPATKDAIGIVLPSARLHVLGNITSTPVSIFQSANGQTADITQWKSNAGNVLAKIDKDGNVDFQKITTAQPSANGAGVYKFGKVITGASVTVQTDKFVEVEIDGVIYKLAIVQ